MENMRQQSSILLHTVLLRLNEIRAICPNKQFSIIIPNGLSVSVSDFKEITKMAYEKLESKAKKLDSQKYAMLLADIQHYELKELAKILHLRYAATSIGK